jgi:hypothetical protein
LSCIELEHIGFFVCDGLFGIVFIHR